MFIVNVFIICFLILVAIFLHHMWATVKQDISDIVLRDVNKDFDRTANAMRFVSFTDCDRLIDNFEERWKPFISSDKLRHYVGKLIECQFQNNVIS